MNLFLPQSVQTRLELEQIADVQRNIITPASSLPIIGIVQDGLLGAYNLTQPTMKIDWKTAMNIMSYTSLDDFSAFKKNTDYAGSELFSLIIPSRINVPGDKFEVKNGNITKGVLNKSMLGSKKPNSLIHLIWDEYGFEETRRFIDNTQRLINNFNLWNGFTVGIGDIDVSKELYKELNNLYETKKLEVNHSITEMENNPDLLDPELFEQTIYSELNAIRDNASKLIMANLKPTNNFNIMITSGSKGDASNMGQMGGCIGQQAVEGNRIQKKLNNRSLPYFHQNDDSALGRGFVEQPYVLGANPIGFIFHNMASREGLIDTAIKSVTGDTPIIILENNQMKMLEIGSWIDRLLRESSDKVEHYTEREMELLKLENKVYIPTTDENGKVSWGEITAITRHDPGKELYEIKTLSGRKVIVTESKSLLIWNKNNKQFERMSTPDVKIGDYVPVTLKLEVPHVDNGIFSKSNIQKSIDTYVNLYGYGKTVNNVLTIKFLDNNERDYVNTLYSMQGIFCKMNERELIVDKNELLKQNDVVLDKIIEINKIDVKLYPKVYDLTVPSTLNFGLANGLHVVDTAESGYIQRKLIKSMEDASVRYDNTVRTGNNTILQFVYGDSGIDTTKQASITFKMLEMNNNEIANKVKFTDQELKNYKNYKTKENDMYYNNVLKLRNTIREARTRTSLNNITFDSEFKIPVNIKNIITNVRNLEIPSSDISNAGKLEPDYILQKLDEILSYDKTKILSMNMNDGNNQNNVKYKDEMLSKTVFRFALYEFLSPKICLFDYGLNKVQFDMICDRIVSSFNNAVVEPGEMIGIVAAQSIGEP